jgi:DnaK suppressor protein
MLTPERLQRLRDELLAEKKGLQQDLENLRPDQLVNDTNSGVGNHPAEDALLTETQEEIVSMRRGQEYNLSMVDRALRRMDEGTYGTCERCGREIDYARLKAQPQAFLCLDCQRLAER